MKVRFLIDGDLSPDYVRELRRYDAAIDVLRIGQPDAPPRGTLDPDVLSFSEQAHLAAGGHHWGIFNLRRGYGLGVYLAELQLIWDVSEAEEWIDQIR